MNFKIVKKGYSQIEVDEYLSRIINDYETKLSEQKDRIFYLKDQLDKITKSSDKELVTSLVSAVEKAKLIENSSKNIYELETKKLSLIYNKMERLLNENKDSKEVREEMLFLIKDCRKSLQNSILKQNENLKEASVADPVRKLLSKMITQDNLYTDNQVSSFVHNKTNVEKAIIERNIIEEKKLLKSEKNKLEQKTENVTTKSEPKTTDEQKISNDKKDFIKNDRALDSVDIKPKHKVEVKQVEQQPVVNLEKPITRKKAVVNNVETTNTESSLDSFLFGDDSNFDGSNFANIMFAKPKKKHENSNVILQKDYGDYTPNESGFDLKEAVNPKEDLEDIMKAFDFYNDNKKKK